MSFLKSVMTVSGYTVVSRLGGFMREVLAAKYLGAGGAADALAVAMRLPAFFRSLCSEGAMNACFVPIFTELKGKNSAHDARDFARQILTFLLVFLSLLTIAVEIFLPSILYRIFPRLTQVPEDFERLVCLARLAFPFVAFISLAAFYGSILNAHNRFSALASAPAVGNIVIILCVLIGQGYLVGPEYAFAAGTLFSGLMQWLWVLVPVWPLYRFLKPCWPSVSLPVRRFFRSLGPILLGAGVGQVNLFIGTVLASSLPLGSIAYLHYADRLNQLPLGVVGVAISTALLPLLSRQLQSGDLNAANESQFLAIRVGLLLTLPAALALIVLAEPLVRITLEYGRFSLTDSKQTAAALAAYAYGLPPYVLVKIFSTRFFASGDTRPPLVASLVGMGVSIIVSLLAIGSLQHVGLALATSVAAWVNGGILIVWLWIRKALCWERRLGHFLWRLFLSCSLTAFLMQLLLWSIAPWIAGAVWYRLLSLGILGMGSLVGFILSVGLFRVITYTELRDGFSSRLRKREEG